MSESTFEELRSKSISLAEAIVENDALPLPLRHRASRELRGGLALGGFPRPKKPEAIPLSPEETQEFFSSFEKLDRAGDLDSDD